MKLQLFAAMALATALFGIQLIGCSQDAPYSVNPAESESALFLPRCTGVANPADRCRGQKEFLSGRMAWSWGWRGMADMSKESASVNREVIESDVFKLNGKTLYILNQTRGLQIVDVSKPDVPRLSGRVEIFGTPREMYIDTARQKAYVLVSDSPLYTEDADVLTESRVAIVDLKFGALQNTLTIPGYIVESRQVGDVVYVVSNEWRYNEETFESGSITTVTSINVAAAQPFVVEKFELPGTGYQIHASSEYFFVAEYYEDGSIIRVLDIRDPKGHIKELSKLAVKGQVYDKFRMSMDSESGVFRVVSNDWSGNIFAATFSPADGQQLGILELTGVGQLLATRFDGQKAYIVHIQRIDPLDVIDFSNPSQPVRLSSLEIPGWLQDLEVRGDRVLGIGYENNRLTVALYDVSDPAQTREISRTYLAEGSSWAWTNFWDSRTFKLIDELGLLLVPYSTYDQSRSYQTVQLVDVDLAGGIVNARGRVDQAGMAVRSFQTDKLIGSFTDRKLTTANIDDRDKPFVSGELELARNIIGFAKTSMAGVQLVADWDAPVELRAVPLDSADAEAGSVYSRLQVKGGERIYGAGRFVVVVHRDWNAGGNGEYLFTAVDYSNPRKPTVLRTHGIAGLSPIYLVNNGSNLSEIAQISPTRFLIAQFDSEGNRYEARSVSFADPRNPIENKAIFPVHGELVEARAVGDAIYVTSFVPNRVEEPVAGEWLDEKSDDEITPATTEPETAVKEESLSSSRFMPPWWGTQVVEPGRHFVTRVRSNGTDLEASMPVNIPGTFVTVDGFGRLVTLDARILTGSKDTLDMGLDTLRVRFTPAGMKTSYPGKATLSDLLDIDDSATQPIFRDDVVYYTTSEPQGGGYSGPIFACRYMPWLGGSNWSLHAADVIGFSIFETADTLMLQRNGTGQLLDVQTVGMRTYALTTFGGYGLGVFDVSFGWDMTLYKFVPTTGWATQLLVDARPNSWRGEAIVSLGMYGNKTISLAGF